MPIEVSLTIIAAGVVVLLTAEFLFPEPRK
jgi:hypothetical protein